LNQVNLSRHGGPICPPESHTHPTKATALHMTSSGFALPPHRAMATTAVSGETSSPRVQKLLLDFSSMPRPWALVSTRGDKGIGRCRRGSQSKTHLATATTFLGVATCLGRRHRRTMHRMRGVDAEKSEVREFLLKKGDAQDVRQLLLSGQTPEMQLPQALRQAGTSSGATDRIQRDPVQTKKRQTTEMHVSQALWQAGTSSGAMGKGRPPPGLPCELQALQGHWEDLEMGFVVHIDGEKANFNDGTGIWKTKLSNGGLKLRGAPLLGGLPDLASWQLPDGRQMTWQRLDPAIVNAARLHKHFLTYKWDRMLLRRKIIAAISKQDFDVAGAMMLFWERGWGFHNEGTTAEEELRLRAGCFLVPGSCVVHRRFGYRGVVLGCEPWVRAPHARRLSAQERELSGTRMYRLQPLYCVLVDDRDVPGGGALFVPEADLEHARSKDVFPLQSIHKERVLEENEAMQAYLPGTALKQAARRQHLGMPFTLQGA